MVTQRQPENVCSQSWSNAIEWCLLGLARGAVDLGPGWFNNTDQWMVIRNNSMKVLLLDELTESLRAEGKHLQFSAFTQPVFMDKATCPAYSCCHTLAFTTMLHTLLCVLVRKLGLFRKGVIKMIFLVLLAWKQGQIRVKEVRFLNNIFKTIMISHPNKPYKNLNNNQLISM